MQVTSSFSPMAGPGVCTSDCPSSMHDYSLNPALVYWEVTRACSLACCHCRAEAIASPQEWELTFAESKSLLLQIQDSTSPSPA